MPALAGLPGIGPAPAGDLCAAGIGDADALRAAGAEKATLRARFDGIVTGHLAAAERRWNARLTRSVAPRLSPARHGP